MGTHAPCTHAHSPSIGKLSRKPCLWQGSGTERCWGCLFSFFQIPAGVGPALKWMSRTRQHPSSLSAEQKPSKWFLLLSRYSNSFLLQQRGRRTQPGRGHMAELKSTSSERAPLPPSLEDKHASCHSLHIRAYPGTGGWR